MKRGTRGGPCDFLATAAAASAVGFVISTLLPELSVVGCLLMFLSLALSGLAVRKSARGEWRVPGMNAVAGMLFLGTVLLYLISTVHEANQGGRKMARRISCASNLKQIGLALKQYSMDNGDFFPPHDGKKGLEMLFKGGYLTDRKIYLCPSTNSRADEKTLVSDYEYIGGLKESDAPGMVICRDKASNHKDYGNALHIDGHVSGNHGKNWIEKAGVGRD